MSSWKYYVTIVALCSLVLVITTFFVASSSLSAVWIITVLAWAPIVFYQLKLTASELPKKRPVYRGRYRRSSSLLSTDQTLVLGAIAIAVVTFGFYREFTLEDNRPGLRMVEGEFTDKTRKDFFSGIVGLPVDVLGILYSYRSGGKYGTASDTWLTATWHRGNAVYKMGYVMGVLLLSSSASSIGTLLAYSQARVKKLVS